MEARKAATGAQSKRRGRPPGKRGQLTGKHVHAMAKHGFGLIAIMRGPQYTHWQATDEELDAWADEAAELLAMIPASVAGPAINLSAALTVAAGLGTMVQRRIETDHYIERMAAARQQAQPTPVRPQPQPPARPESAAAAEPNHRAESTEDELIPLVGIFA